MKFLIYASLILLLLSCNQEESTETEVFTDSLDIKPVDSPLVITDGPYFWRAEEDGTGNIEMKKVRPISSDSLNYTSVINLFNTTYPNVNLKVSRLSNDTIYLSIPDSRYLTQQMGSTGASTYLQEVTWNLTELGNIHFTNYNFEPGDHATPGTYSRADFIPVNR